MGLQCTPAQLHSEEGTVVALAVAGRTLIVSNLEAFSKEKAAARGMRTDTLRSHKAHYIQSQELLATRKPMPT